MMNLSGINPPLTTPFIDGEVAYEKLEENIAIYNKTDLNGYVLLGSYGEAYFLNQQEKLRIIETARKAIPTDKTLIAGVNIESTTEAIKFVNQVAGIGADVAMISTPCYYKGAMTEDALYRHFAQIADEAAIPIVVYNMPRYTGINLSPDLIVRLSEHPNIVGAKDSSGNLTQMEEVVSRVNPNFKYLLGAASILYAGLCLGAAGGILAAADVLPQEFCQLYKNSIEKKHDAAKQLQLRLLSISKALTITYGIAGGKAAMDMMGYYGGAPRSPIRPLSAEGKKTIKKLLQEGGFLK
jgi:4-hydroxy-2-oxoglutarate aldolase